LSCFFLVLLSLHLLFHLLGNTLHLTLCISLCLHDALPIWLERGSSSPRVGLKLPWAACTPSRPSNTQSGSGTCAMALPATMSSAIQLATCFQPAACQLSNGPRLQP